MTVSSDYVHKSIIESAANSLMRYAGRGREFRDGVLALAEAIGVSSTNLTTITDADLETMLKDIEVQS